MTLSLLLVSFLTFVELNCENLFDCQHDSLKNDTEYLPQSARHWTPRRYWQKLNNVSKEIISCGSDSGDYVVPDFVALCEVENDTVMRDLTRRSLLRNANYDYVMTHSADERGIDVALLYSPFSFLPITTSSLPVATKESTRALRDILYVSGRIVTDDTLHIFIVHAPSRYGGERKSRPLRMAFARVLCHAVDSIMQLSPNANIIVAGDFNDYATDSSLVYIANHGMINVTRNAHGSNGAKGTYSYQGEWGCLDHIFVSKALFASLESSRIHDAPFLLEEDKKYGGVKPRRTYTGYRYSAYGYSDHLPSVVRFRLDD